MKPLAATPGTSGVDIESVWPLAGNFTNLADLFSFLLPKILLLGGVVFFVLVVASGIGVVASAGGGDAQGQERAKNFLTSAILGFIIMFGAYWVLQIINFITGGALSGLGF